MTSTLVTPTASYFSIPDHYGLGPIRRRTVAAGEPARRTLALTGPALPARSADVPPARGMMAARAGSLPSRTPRVRSVMITGQYPTGSVVVGTDRSLPARQVVAGRGLLHGAVSRGVAGRAPAVAAVRARPHTSAD